MCRNQQNCVFSNLEILCTKQPCHSYCHTRTLEKIKNEQFFVRSVTEKIKMPVLNRPKIYLTVNTVFCSRSNKQLLESKNPESKVKYVPEFLLMYQLANMFIPGISLAMYSFIYPQFPLQTVQNCRMPWQGVLQVLSVDQRDTLLDLFWIMFLLP